MTTLLKVTKRDGRLETINLDKIHRVLDWAAEGLTHFAVPDIINRISWINPFIKINLKEIFILKIVNLISKKILETKNIHKINSFKITNQLSRFKTAIFYIPKTFLTICLKSTLILICKGTSETKNISIIALLRFVNQLSRFKTIAFYIPKIFLTARLKSTLFNDTRKEVSLYA